MSYAEIDQLQKIWDLHNVSLTPVLTDFLTDNIYFPLVKCTINNEPFNIYVDNEYDDLQLRSNLLSFCMVLRSLENYALSADYLQWCNEHALVVNNHKNRDYYMSLGGVYRRVQESIGTIDSCISDFDFELNAGAAQYLRNA
ncbi:MAG: hypothetical protein JJ975_02265 [Bacteroidia bacterium]|nr:hypothetical protein [Bacteroidia bacterium]